MKPIASPYCQNPWLRMSYSLIAPLYDTIIERPMRMARQQSLAALPTDCSQRVLLSGVGTGLDIPLLPTMHRYVALDFNAAMLARAHPRAETHEIEFILGDSMALPFADASFDHVILHLIVAVVPEPQRCLSEAARVLKPGGSILLFDKFLRPDQSAWLRRALTPLSRRIATRMDVIFEEVMQVAPTLEIVSNEGALGGQWFRRIVLRKPQ
jgi:ubiquinone/menaquinone biosynthesis C-methylase UbiE